MYFQDIYSNLWKVQLFSGNINSLKSNTYFWGAVLHVQDGFFMFESEQAQINSVLDNVGGSNPSPLDERR